MKKDSIPERARDLIFICWLHGKVTRTINEKISISFLARTELDVYFASRNYFQTLIIEIRLEAQKKQRLLYNFKNQSYDCALESMQQNVKNCFSFLAS